MTDKPTKEAALAAAMEQIQRASGKGGLDPEPDEQFVAELEMLLSDWEEGRIEYDLPSFARVIAKRAMIRAELAALAKARGETE